jgi:uncharacterized membrane protein YhiD involved in acid resistance
LQPLQDFITTTGVAVDPVMLLVNMILAALLATILARVYVRFGTSLSNRSTFARTFALVATTTALIITIVKSSLALSLGLVGALSIVRFRAAIKEPEELAYLFVCIALGLGFGANQTMATIPAFVLIIGLIVVSGWYRKRSNPTENLYLTVANDNPGGIELGDVVRAVTETCVSANLRRFDERPNSLEAAFLVEFSSYEQLEAAKKRLCDLHESMQVSFVDQRGIL